VYIPKALSLSEIVKFVLSVLGITWAQIRGKIVKVIGETAMTVLETGFDLVVTLIREGPGAIWQKIVEQLTNLKDMVIGGITDMVVGAVIQKAIPQLLSLFIPGAGFITALIKIYDTIMVFVKKIAKIAQVVNAFIDSIVRIAAGDISEAAAKVENILGNLLSLAINFFAGFVGLGNVTEKIRDVLAKIRGAVDKAIDAVIAWIVKTAKALYAKAKAFVKKLFGKEEEPKKATPESPAEDGGQDFPTYSFTVEGETHTLAFQGTQVPTVASRPSPVDAFIHKVKLSADDIATVEEQLKVIGDCVRDLKVRPRTPEIRETLRDVRERLRNAQVAIGDIVTRYFAKIKNEAERELTRYALEGTAGPYSSLQFPNDRMEADHQPQHAILAWAANQPFVDSGGRQTGIKLFTGRRLRQVVASGGRSHEAMAIVLGIPRHRAGRTGSRSEQRGEALEVGMLNVSVVAMLDSESAQAQRAAVLRALRFELLEDVAAMRQVVARKADDPVWADIEIDDADKKEEVIKTIRAHVRAGETEMALQSLQSYAAKV
jgi:hypothetical protein